MKKLFIAAACTLALAGLAQAEDKMEAAKDVVEHTQEAAAQEAKAAQAADESKKATNVVTRKTKQVKKKYHKKNG